MQPRLKQIIEDAIPLNQKCAIERNKEILRRAKLRLDIEELMREQKPKLQSYEPRTELKHTPY